MLGASAASAAPASKPAAVRVTEAVATHRSARPHAARAVASRPPSRIRLGRATTSAVKAGPSVTQASVTCTDSWLSATSGNWNTTTDWSTGLVPTSTDNACITVAGTYTVTVSDSETTGTLTLGGSSGTQTLDIAGGAGTNAELTLDTATGSNVKAHGLLELDSPANDGYGAIGGGNGVTLTNDGTFETEDATTNIDYIDVNLTNDSGAKVVINGGTTDLDEGTTTTNNGTFTISSATPGSLDLSSSSVVVNSGGTFADNGSVSLNSSSWTQSGGSETGGTIGLSNNSSMTDSAGAGSFSFINSDTLSGTVASGQTMTVIGPVGQNSILSLASPGVTNKGTFVLDSQANGGYADVGGSPLTNNGTFETIGATTNTDYIEANLTNSSTGTVSIAGASTLQDHATTTVNKGSWTVTSTGGLSLSASAVLTDSAGTFVDNGSVNLNNCTWNQSGAVESGNTISLVNSSTLTDSAGGGAFSLVNTATLSGTIPVGQTVTVLGVAGQNSTTYLGGTVTNDGTFALDTPANAGYASVYDNNVAANNLVNDGTFETLDGTTNQDQIEAPLTNAASGTVSIAGQETIQNDPTTTTNNGSFTVTPTGALSLSGGAAVVNSGGTFADNGSVSLNSSSWTQSGGSETGGTVASSNGSTLTDSVGGGSFSFTGNNTLSGTIPSGQTVTVIGPSGQNSTLSLASPGVTNDGTFALDSQANGGYADVNGSPLTNNGTFETVGATTGIDYIEANLTNTSSGTVSIGGASTSQDQGTTTTNNGSWTVTSAAGLSLTGSSVFTNSAGTVTDTGSISISSSTWNQSGGAESGNAVAVSNGWTINDSAGPGSFNAIGNGTLNGTVPSGQTINVLGQPGENTTMSLGGTGVTNDGTINIDSQVNGGYADVSGSALTNNGLLETTGATTQIDYIEANVTNNQGGTIEIAGVTSRQDEATTTTNSGTFEVTDGAAIALTGGGLFTQTSTGTYAPTVDASTGVWGLSGGDDTVAGTLAIATVGSPTLGTAYQVITGANSLAGTFSAFSFGPHAYAVTYSSTAVTATVATPFSLTGKNPTLNEHIPNKKITVASGTNGSQAGPTYTATINWGDGSAPSTGRVTVTGSTFSVTGSHVYTAKGTYTATTTVSDQWGTTQTVTGKVTVKVPAAPTLTASTPSIVVQGKSATLTLTGSNLTNNATVTFSNPGVTVGKYVWVSASTATVAITVAKTAAPGPVNITVTTVGGSATCTGCLTIDALPKVTGVSPALVAGVTTTVTVRGTGFQVGLTVGTNISGATVGTPTDVTATSFQVSFTVPAGTAPGTYEISVTNPDGGKGSASKLRVVSGS